MKNRDYRDYLHDILDAINDVENFIGNLSANNNLPPLKAPIKKMLKEQEIDNEKQ